MEVFTYSEAQEGLQKLLCCPLRRGMLGDSEVYWSVAVVRKNYEYKQQPKRGCGNYKEIDSDEILDVIRQERTPRL